MTAADDTRQIRDLVENWAVWRDAGDWERFAHVWHDDGWMLATWFQGPARRFHSRQPRGLGEGREHSPLPRRHVDRPRRRSRHRPDQDDDLPARAVHGVLCDVVCTGRFYDFLKRRNGRLGPGPAPADLRERPARPGRSGGPGSSSTTILLVGVPRRLSPSRLHPDADRLPRQARHAGAERTRGRGALPARGRVAGGCARLDVVPGEGCAPARRRARLDVVPG